MIFKVEYTHRAVRDLSSLAIDVQKKIVQETILLETNPFPFKDKIKRIQGMKFPC